MKLQRDLPSRGHEDWEAVYWLYKRAWFSRVWVVQEVAQDMLADMFIGDLSVPWVSVGMAAFWLISKRYTVLAEHTAVLTPASTILATVGAGGPPPSLLMLLTGCSSFKATDVRDKLFALLGLSREGQELQKGSLIQPDYRKSVVDTFTDLARYLISAPRGPGYGSGGLDVLGGKDMERITEDRNLTPRWFDNERESDNDDGKFPSWVAHFDRSVPATRALSFTDLASSWTTSHDSAVMLGQHSSPSSLVLKGVKIATVKQAYPDAKEHGNREPGSQNSIILQVFTQISQSLPNYQGPDSFGEAFARTITAGRSRPSNKSDPFHEADLDSFFSFLETGVQSSTAYWFRRKISYPIHRLFVTDDGHVGIGSLMIPGDEVWILFGGRVLYVLRPVGDHYVFVGECYFHGYMHGEGMEKWKEGKLQDEWVELR